MRSPIGSLRSSRALAALVAAAACLAAAAPVLGQSLRGSRASMDRQNREARRHDFTFLDTPSQVHRFAELGYLVPVRGNGDYALKPGVPYPYARPEVRLFLERLGSQYRAACGERLIVTSLTRPRTRQPRNASARSVHPTGMAMDLRVSGSSRCRSWIEGTFLALEGRGLLEANREYHPPHYHVALFPRPYAGYVARLEPGGANGAVRTAARSDAPAPAESAAAARYTVRRGDTLWRIASRHGTSVDRLQAANEIRSTRIRPGQVLEIPAPR
jgi:LysM repeat protein